MLRGERNHDAGVGDRPSGLLVGGLRAVGRRARARLGCRRARAARDADGPGHEAAAAEALLRRGASRRWVTARRRPLKTAAGRELGSGSDSAHSVRLCIGDKHVALVFAQSTPDRLRIDGNDTAHSSFTRCRLNSNRDNGTDQEIDRLSAWHRDRCRSNITARYIGG